MLRYIKIAILIFASFGVLPLAAQNTKSDFPSEELKIITSQQLLFPGETIWFSIFSVNTIDETDLSTRAFVELVNSSNTAIVRKKVKLSDGTGNSYFQLPDSLSTGIYRILAYTSWMKNFGLETLPFHELAIINPEQPFGALNLAKVNSSVIKPGKNIKRSTKRKRLMLAELIDLTQSVNGTYSLSIKRKEPQTFIATKRNATIDNTSNKTVKYLPDYKGIVVSGTLFKADNKAAVGEKVLLSIPGSGADLQSATSDFKGGFSFLLSNNSANQDLVFTLPNPEMKIKLDDPFINQHKLDNTPVIQVDSLTNIFLQEKYFYWQLAQKFGSNSSEPIHNTASTNSPFTFYSSPNRSFNTKDYIQLDSLTEYFHELIPSVKFRQNKNKYTIRVIRAKGKVDLGSNPGVFVDGVYLTEYGNIANIPTDKLDKIEVLWNKYHYKDFIFDGIVSIHTKKADFYSVDLQKNMTRIIYPLSDLNSIQFKLKNYSENNIASKRPDLRHLLYWNPRLKLNDLEQLFFFTSDVSGTYEISISGYTINGVWKEISNDFIVTPVRL